MPLEAHADFHSLQKKWWDKWQAQEIYKFNNSAKAKGEVYSIDSPPPFTSGALHMGHVLSYAFFDFAARYKRMAGYNVFFPQGWDCQGFPTEVKVEKVHGRTLSRPEFKKKCIEFTLENIEKMKKQMHTLGFSPDWNLEYKTIDPEYRRKVQLSILEMYEKNLVNRSKHPVLYCINCQSAIAKAETEDVQRESKLNYIVFKTSASGSGKATKQEKEVTELSKELLIATTRPELLHACVAVMVNPADLRYKELIGKTASTSLYNKPVPIIADPDVDKEFGTGTVMLCTFGDKTDVAWAYRHSLPIIEAIDRYGKLINSRYDGLSLSKAREQIISDLSKEGLLKKQEAISQNVKTHDRCGKVVEFYLSYQWFMSVMQWKEKIKQAAKKMNWVPEFSLRYLEDWADFVEYDWVISRQRIYGTPLPFYYCESCAEIYPVKKSSLPVDPAVDKFEKEKCKCGGKIIGETAVCDCWVDSSITPLIIAGWPDNKELMKKAYPASLRPQGLEIIRTWAFYTIYRCLALTGEKPFETVLINGSVLGTDGKKMSKSVGNFEDPEVLLARFPADALRGWAALSGALARDRAFSYKDIEYFNSFLTKLWNASRFVQTSLDGYKPPKTVPKTVAQNASKTVQPTLPTNFNVVDKWLLSELHSTIDVATKAMDNYDYYAAITAVQGFFWHSFCDYYLEDVKHRIYSKQSNASKNAGANASNDTEPNADAARYVLRETLVSVLKMLAPFAPFTTEELFHELKFSEAEKVKSIHLSKWPQHVKEFRDKRSEELAALLHTGIAASRKFRGANAISQATELLQCKVALPPAMVADFSSISSDFSSIARIKSLLVSQNSGSSEPTFEFTA